MEGASTSEIIASPDVVTQMMPPPLSCLSRRGPCVCGCKRSRAQLGQRLGSPRKRPKAKWPLSLLALKTAESPPWRATSTAEVVAMTCVCTRIHVCTHAIRRSSQPTCTYDVHVFRCFTPRPNPVMARMSGEARMVSKPWIVLQRTVMRTCAPPSWGTATANGASTAPWAAGRYRQRLQC
jgi:hypothetical protein